MKRLFALLVFIAAATTAHAAPSQVTARYQLLLNGLVVGQIDETYRQSAGRYTIESVAIPVGPLALFKREKITLSSSGSLTASGLRPARFSQTFESSPGKNVSADFDWSRRTLTLTHGDKVETVALKDGTQDRLSMMYNFLAAPLKGSSYAIAMTNGRNVEDYECRKTGESELTLPIGRVATINLERERKEPGDRDVKIWLARDRHQLPAKIVFNEGNGHLDQVLVSLETR